MPHFRKLPHTGQDSCVKSTCILSLADIAFVCCFCPDNHVDVTQITANFSFLRNLLGCTYPVRWIPDKRKQL